MNRTRDSVEFSDRHFERAELQWLARVELTYSTGGLSISRDRQQQQQQQQLARTSLAVAQLHSTEFLMRSDNSTSRECNRFAVTLCVHVELHWSRHLGNQKCVAADGPSCHQIGTLRLGRNGNKPKTRDKNSEAHFSAQQCPAENGQSFRRLTKGPRNGALSWGKRGSTIEWAMIPLRAGQCVCGGRKALSRPLHQQQVTP